MGLPIIYEYPERDRFTRSDSRRVFGIDTRPSYMDVTDKDMDLRGIMLFEHSHMLTTLCLLYENPIMKADYYTFIDKNGNSRLNILECLELIEYKTVGRAKQINLTSKGSVFAERIIGLNEMLLTKDKDLKEDEISLRIHSRLRAESGPGDRDLNRLGPLRGSTVPCSRSPLGMR